MPADTTPAAYRGRSFQFTEARVAAARRAARPEDADSMGRRSWRDDACKGLSLVVNTNTGTAAYYFVGKANGQTTRRVLGDADTVRLEEAREAVNRLRFDKSLTAILAPRPVEPSGEPVGDDSPLVGTVVADYLDAHEAGRWLPGGRSRRPTDRTMKFYRDLRRATLTEHEGLTLAAFAAALPAAYGKLQKRAPIQANRFVQLVRNIYAYAADAGLWSGINPAIGGARTDRLTRTAERSRTRVLTDAEWKRLDAAMAADDPLWRDLFTFSLLTLQRIGACRQARWSDITLTGKDAEWRIPAAMMKGRKSGHTVPLADIPAARAILEARRKAAPKGCVWVFAGADGEPARNHDKAWRRILERAKLDHEDREERPRPHDLRRTGGARMTAAGIPLGVVTRALGNAASSVAMVSRVYAVVLDDTLRDAFRQTSKRMPRRR